MPIYEYQCQQCGHRLEAMQKISDDPLLTCPSCDAEALKKLISAPAFQFKGSGWYVTDYTDKGKSSKKDSAGASDGGDKKESKSDTASNSTSKDSSASTDSSSSKSGSSSTSAAS